MQAEIDNSRKTTHEELRNLPGMSPTEILTDMPFCVFETGYFVPYKTANSIKSLMSQLQNKENSTMIFQSKVVDGGIVVWKKSKE